MFSINIDHSQYDNNANFPNISVSKILNYILNIKTRALLVYLSLYILELLILAFLGEQELIHGFRCN